MLALRTLLFTVLIPGTVTIAVPSVLLSSDLQVALHIGSPVRWLGMVPLACGVAIYAWCAWDFGAAGKGTPAPYDPPRLLVTRGLYRYTRNPIYIAIALISVSEGVLFDSLTLIAYAASLLVLFHLRILLYEEPHLRRNFGAAYDAYCQAVPRWIPRTARRS